MQRMAPFCILWSWEDDMHVKESSQIALRGWLLHRGQFPAPMLPVAHAQLLGQRHAESAAA